jgi:antirestriction protein ArdC
MSQTPDKKTRIQLSTEAQQDFAQGIARSMAALAKRTDALPLGHAMPFSAVTGREYSGANMTRLILASMEKGYADNRWMTMKQIDKVRADNPDLHIHVRKGEQGIKLLRPQAVSYVMSKDKRRHALNPNEVEDLRKREAKGEKIPEIKTAILYCPYTVFNAEQVQNFPPKEHPAPAMNPAEGKAFLQSFVASSGVSVAHSHEGTASYDDAKDEVVLPSPLSFGPSGSPAYSALLLREFFHATAGKNRENRLASPFKAHTLKEHAIEEMRADMFALMAAQYMGMRQDAKSLATEVTDWQTRFAGTDAKALFHAAADAGKVLTAMHQFHEGEPPEMKWFPPSDEWTALREKQKERTRTFLGRDLLHRAASILARNTSTTEFAETAQSVLNDGKEKSVRDSLAKAQELLSSDAVRSMPLAAKLADAIGKYFERPELVIQMDMGQGEKQDAAPKMDAAAYKALNDPVKQVRAILRNPDFLDLALKQPPESARDIASLCGSMASALSMELEERQANAARQNAPEKDSAANAPRHRTGPRM